MNREKRDRRLSDATLEVAPSPDIAALETAAESPECITRDDVLTLEQAGAALMRNNCPEQSVRLFAMALRWQLALTERERRKDRRENIDGKARRGAWAESVAVSFLIEQGYDVFRNATHTGPIDLVAVSAKGESILIDVKTTAARKRPDLPRYGMKPSEAQLEIGVRYLYVDPNGTCRWEAP